jgi:hypothetical protein
MKCNIKMVSSAMLYIPSFINIGSGIKKVMEGGIHRRTDRWEIA